jgi:N-acetylglutamate synthase-like GNAT family acetyltransferase
MREDYAAVIRDKRVTVAEQDGEVVGVLVLSTTEEGFGIDNVAVDPSRRDTGLGKALLELAEAEARRAGFDSIHLYTHEGMVENVELYSRIGYVEYDRRSMGEFSLVFMRKRLTQAAPRVASGGLLRRRQQRPDDPKQRDEDADDEHDPVALADRDDPQRDQQNEIEDAANDEFHSVLPCTRW